MKLTTRPSGVAAAIVHLLTNMAQVIELRQIAERFCRGDVANARRLSTRLVENGWLRCRNVVARTTPQLAVVASWKPGEAVPDAGAVSYRTQHWHELPVVEMKCFAATGRAANVAGVPVSRLKWHQCGHDVAVAAVALEYVENLPDLAELWSGEVAMAHTRANHGDKLPDALLVRNGQVVRAVEICTGYSTRRVREFIEDCVNRDLEFEIWG